MYSFFMCERQKFCLKRSVKRQRLCLEREVKRQKLCVSWCIDWSKILYSTPQIGESIPFLFYLWEHGCKGEEDDVKLHFYVFRRSTFGAWSCGSIWEGGEANTVWHQGSLRGILKYRSSNGLSLFVIENILHMSSWILRFYWQNIPKFEVSKWYILTARCK